MSQAVRRFSSMSAWRIGGLFLAGLIAGLAAAPVALPLLSTWNVPKPSAASVPVKWDEDHDHDHPGHVAGDQADHHDDAPEHRDVVELSKATRESLNVVAKEVTPQDYWRSIMIPGEVVDRPGVTDRGVTAPAVGVVSEVHAFPGDTVQAGERLFTVRLVSEYIQKTQAELFRAVKETDLIGEQKERLAKAAEGGAIPQSRLIDLDQQLRRQAAAILSFRQDLLARGLTPAQIARVTEGEFVSSVDVLAPGKPGLSTAAKISMGFDEAVHPHAEDLAGSPSDGIHVYEVQELKVQLGQQVEAGQLLGLLSNHRILYIAGHAFKRDAPSLEVAAQNGWPIRAEFSEDEEELWPPLGQTLQIRHLANAIDPVSRTFDFFVPLENQLRSYERESKEFAVWRFRPGQRVRLYVPVEKLSNVLVLPLSALVRENGQAFVFSRNGSRFTRQPVQIRYEDRQNVVVDGGDDLKAGAVIVQTSAGAVNRVMKAQLSAGAPAGFHVHADGSIHGNH